MYWLTNGIDNIYKNVFSVKETYIILKVKERKSKSYILMNVDNYEGIGKLSLDSFAQRLHFIFIITKVIFLAFEILGSS